MLTHFKELLGPLGAVGARAMFGGHGIYVDELFIAIVIDDQLYLKVDALTEPEFTRAGSSPFVYEKAKGVRAQRRPTGKSQPVQMSYWLIPDEALESPHAMRPWAQLAIAAAKRKPGKGKSKR